MGWTNTHLYEILARGTGWGIPDPDWGDGPLDARKARLIDVLEDVGTKTLKYLYDFGDGWEHTVKVERIAAPEPAAVRPKTSAARGVTLNCSRPLTIPSTNVTPSSKSGSPTTSILLSSISNGSLRKSLPSRSAGRESRFAGRPEGAKSDYRRDDGTVRLLYILIDQHLFPE